MTEQEKQQLVEAVITQLKNEGTDVSSATVVEDVSGVSYVLCYDTNGNIVRVSPSTINQQENENKAAIETEVERATEAEAGLREHITEVDNNNTKTATEIKSKAVHYGTLHATPSVDEVNIGGKSVDGNNTMSVNIPAATSESAGVMSAEDKAKIDSGFVGTTQSSQPIRLNTYTLEGVYNFLNVTLADVSPILNSGIVNARLTVLKTQESNNTVITQVLSLNNLGGGEGNIYIRSNQNGWKPWAKLQTNVEVGQITPGDMSNLIDNGIYSGVCVDGDTVETFVLIVINNYLAASQAGFGSYISQLKYAIDLNRGNTVKTRTRDAYGIWDEWSEIGGSTYKLPEATASALGGVKLGATLGNHSFMPLVNISAGYGSGVGIKLDSASIRDTGSGLGVYHNDSLGTTDSGFSVMLGTGGDKNNKFGLVIPCVLGTGVSSDNSEWDAPSIGIPYNQEQFCLKENGLNLKDIGSDIGSATSEVDITEYLADGSQYLITLMAGGTIKEGLTYIVKLSSGMLSNIRLDSGGKITDHMVTHSQSYRLPHIIKIKYIGHVFIIDYYAHVDSTYSDDTEPYYYRYIMDYQEKYIKVSADMIEL